MSEPLRCVSVVPAGQSPDIIPFDLAVLRHDERRIRRRLIRLQHGDEVLVDFPQPVTLVDRDCLKLADGRQAEIIAAEEELYEIVGRDAAHLNELAWHIGNRHAKAEIVAEAGAPRRILILRDHVLRDMLTGLGATVKPVSEPFSPMDGAYAHSHGDAGHALLNR